MRFWVILSIWAGSFTRIPPVSASVLTGAVRQIDETTGDNARKAKVVLSKVVADTKSKWSLTIFG